MGNTQCSGHENPSEPEPESEPESESEPEAETEVTPPSTGDTESTRCVAVSGMGRGVSDSDCAHCLSGRTTWPCNEQVLCSCPSHCVFDNFWTCSTSLAQVGVTRRLRKGSTHGSLTVGTAFVQQMNTMTVQNVSDEL